MAGLRAGERFVDLGCGDGRVLLAAAQRGAVVTGVELDPDLAGKARRLLALADVPGTIIERDFADVGLDADVMFAFLSPATLQRLGPRFEHLPEGSRVVTTGFALVDWEPERVDDRCFLYRMPPRRAAVPAHEGWASAGVVAGVRADATSLTSVALHHPGGRVVITADEVLGRAVTLEQGADTLDAPGSVMVDLRWDARPPGAVVAGGLHAPPLGSLAVFGVYTDGPTGVWALADEDAREQVARALGAADASPEALLDRARASLS